MDNGRDGGGTVSPGPHSLLCLPVHDNSCVLGVISLLDKEKGFSENDARFAEAFSLFCGMAIRNAAELERTLMSEAKLQVVFEVMNYQASSSEEEAEELERKIVPSATKLGIRAFDFSYLGMPDMDTYTVSYFGVLQKLGSSRGFLI
jgi:hypothetical protein